MFARIFRRSKRLFDCYILQENKIVKNISALGNLLKNKNQIVVGDYVKLEKQNNNQYIITSVEDRKNTIFKIIQREKKKKINAANCDWLVIVSSVSKPIYKQGIVDRFIVRSIQWNIPILLVFNKMDTFNEDINLNWEHDRLKELNISCFEISAKLKERYRPKFLKLGYEDLKIHLNKTTNMFMGQSGVGKSTLISVLSNINLKTHNISKSGKGTHTTSWYEIINCSSFYLVDSPGIRSFGLDDINPDELINFFPDIKEVSLKCSFSDCQHQQDTKGCAFYNKLNDNYKNQLLISRLKSYYKIYQEISKTPVFKKNYKL